MEPYFGYDASEREAPLLRIWGSFQDRAPSPTIRFERDKSDDEYGQSSDQATEYDVQLSHHDSRDGQVDLSQPSWFEGVRGFDEFDLKLSRQKVAQNIPLRSDRLTSANHWTPFQRIVHLEVERDRWVPLQLVLWNRSRSTWRTVQPPPTPVLLKSISLYIQKHSNGNSEGQTTSTLPLLTADSIETRALIPCLVRGRKKRALRHSRFATSDDNSIPEVSCVQRTEISFYGTPRGRLKRRIRRNKMYGRTSANSATNSATTTPDASAQDAQKRDPSMLQNRGLLANLQKQNLPTHLLECPQIAVADSFQRGGWSPTVEYHPVDKAIAIPIKNKAGNSIMGLLLISKMALQCWRRETPWDSAIVDNIEIALTKLEVSEDKPSSNTGRSTMERHWQKFPVRACELYKDLLWDDTSNTHMKFAMLWSYQCPALFSPDESEGMYANEEEYCHLNFLVSPEVFRHSDFDQTVKWLRDETNTIWDAQRTEWKNTDLRNVTVDIEHASGMAQVATPPRAWQREKETDLKSSTDEPKLAEEEKATTESQEQPDGPDKLGIVLPTEIAAAPLSEPQNDGRDDFWEFVSSSDFHENDEEDSNSIHLVEETYKETYAFMNKYNIHIDIFYVTRYFDLVPWWTQENRATKMLEVINNSKNDQATRAQAMIQYSLCLFSGFGVTRDTEQGLRWFWLAAKTGSQRAQAAVQRLFRSYGKKVPDGLFPPRWLIRGAKSGSQWALKELRHEDPSTYEAEVVDQAFQFLKERATNVKEPKELEEIFREVEPQIKGLISRSRDQQAELSRWSESSARQFLESGGLQWATCYADLTTVKNLLAVYAPLYDERQSLLIAALAAGRVEIAHLLLDQMLLNDEQPFRDSADNPLFTIHRVPDDQVGAIVAKLVQLGSDVNVQLNVSRFSYSFFSDWQTQPFLDGIMKSKRDEHWVFRPNGLSITPLRWAVGSHKPAVVKALLDHGAVFARVPDVKTYTDMRPEGFGPEHATVAVLDSPCYDLEILQMFLLRHGNQRKKTVFAETPLGLISTEPDSPERRLRIGHRGRRESLFPVLDLLRSYQTNSDPELFRAAVMNGHLEVVEYLLKRGVSIELRCCGLTPLHTAVLYGQQTIFDYLLELGADPSANTTRRGISAAHLIFWKPKAAAVETYMLSELSRRGVDVLARNTTFGKSVSPLHLAVIGARVAAVDRLLQSGADRSQLLGEEVMPAISGARLTDWGIKRSKRVDPEYVYARDKDVVVPIKGLTPLGIVLQRWDMYAPEDLLRLVKLLCIRSDNLQDFYVRPDLKQTALHLACCHTVLVGAAVPEYLLEQGRDAGLHMNIPDRDGDTPLHYAALLSAGRQRVIKLGADPNVRNTNGMTPADLRLWGHMHEIETKPAGIGFKCLEFSSVDRERPKVPDDSPGEGEGTASKHDSPCARLWARLADGIIFRDVWDLETGAWHTLNDDVVLQLRIGSNESGFFPYERWFQKKIIVEENLDESNSIEIGPLEYEEYESSQDEL